MRQLNRLAAGTAVAAIAAVAGAGLAQADGMPGKRVVYEKPWDWGGLYFGVHAGWAWADVDSEFRRRLAVDVSEVSLDAPIVGGQIGIQHQFGQFVLGVEGSGVFSYNDDYSNVSCPNPAMTCGKHARQHPHGRPAGSAMAMGKWMPYITGGYANAHFAQELRSTAQIPTDYSSDDRLEGWYIGGGVDMALAHGWTVGLEYRHYDFDDRHRPDVSRPAGYRHRETSATSTPRRTPSRCA